MGTPKPIRWDAPPNLAVIDYAVQLIESGRELHPTHALNTAFLEIEVTPSSHWPTALQRCRLYRDQFRDVVLTWHVGMTWWNSPSPYKEERINALNAFRQACIDAAETQPQNQEV